MKLVENNGRWYIHYNGAIIAVKALRTLLQLMPSHMGVIKVLEEQHHSDTFGYIDAERVVEFFLLAKQLAAMWIKY